MTALTGVVIFFCSRGIVIFTKTNPIINMALPSQADLRHQIALILGVDSVTPEDLANAAAFYEQRKAVKIVNGEIVDGPEPEGLGDLFYAWIQAGSPPITGADLVEFVLILVNRAANPEPPNTK